MAVGVQDFSVEEANESGHVSTALHAFSTASHIDVAGHLTMGMTTIAKDLGHAPIAGIVLWL